MTPPCSHKRGSRAGAALLALVVAGCSDGFTAIDLKGTVVDEAGTALLRQRVLVVDSRAQQLEATSDEEGRFQVAGVAPPSDVKLQGLASAYVYLGLTRPEIRLALPSEGPAPSSTSGGDPARTASRSMRCSRPATTRAMPTSVSASTS